MRSDPKLAWGHAAALIAVLRVLLYYMRAQHFDHALHRDNDMSMFTAGTASTRLAVDLSLHQSELVTSAAIYKNSCDSCHAAK